jgi:CheY-like chemotaxis protein
MPEPVNNNSKEPEVIQNDRIAAHDINNLFGSIFANIELLKRNLADNTEALFLLENIEHCSRRATEITSEFLNADNSEKRRDNRINTRLLINEVVSSIIHSIPAGIKIITDIESRISDLKGNSTELYQVIVNILLNAIESIKGEGEIRISAKNVEKGPNNKKTEKEDCQSVSITLLDNGEGIDANNINKIFEPYFSTKNRGRVSGVGLFSVMKIVTNHNGKIEVESKLGYGTAFKLILPSFCRKGRVRKENKVKILIADDEYLLVSILDDLLTGLGFNIITVRSAEEAIEKIKQDDTIDLLLIDFRMEGMDGLSAIREIRNFNDELKIILSTGSVGIKNFLTNNEHHVDGLLQKPYELDSLLAEIEKVID